MLHELSKDNGYVALKLAAEKQRIYRDNTRRMVPNNLHYTTIED